MAKLLKFFFSVMISCLVLLVLEIYVWENEYPLQDAVLKDDPLAGKLPDDEKIAKRELQRARKTLRKFKPSEPYIVINTHTNKVLLRTEDSVLLEAVSSTGSGHELLDSASGRHWKFDTPAGVFKVESKIKDPWWRKPDWAYIEENEAIPGTESERLDPQMMGEYAIGFGDGYFIHGTIYERLLGISVTHGCVRLGAKDLAKLYSRVKIGTLVYVF